MLVGIGGAAGANVLPPPRATQPTSSAASDYAADWGPSASATPTATPTPSAPVTTAPSAPASPTPSPSPGIAPQPPVVLTPAQVAAQKAAERSQLQTAQTDAKLAEDVYNDTANPPAGWHVASDAELAGLGISPQMLSDGHSDFRARVYEGPDGRTVIAFRGSQSKQDWKNDIEQGVGIKSEYYDRAIKLGERVARSGEPVTFTGHSLGGGLASAAAIASGGKADTFNAAGLTSKTIASARAADVSAGGSGRSDRVQAWYDRGDPLSRFQDTNAAEDGILGGLGGFILGGPLGGLLGGGLGAEAGHAPSAYGARHELDTVDAPNAPSGLDLIKARHGMDYIDRGLDRALAQLH